MRTAFLRWNENYFETFRATRFLTQSFAFCIAITLFLELGRSTYLNITFQGEVSPQIWQSVFRELTIQIFVVALFAARFSLLFFKDKKYFWLSQFVWLFTYLLLLSQFSGGGCIKNAFSIFNENFSYVFFAYLFISPLRQLTTLFVSFSGISGK